MLHNVSHQAEPQKTRENLITAVEIVVCAVVMAALNCYLRI